MSQPPKHARPFFAPEKLRELMQKNIVEGFQKKLNAIETADYKLQVKDLKIEGGRVTPEMEKKAIMEKKDLTLPLKGTVDLIHKPSGNVVESKHLTLAHVPHITNRQTVIYNGSEYESINQQRLLPGIYTRMRQDGIAEAHINPAPRTGQAARILFLPQKQLFVLMIQNTQISLYSILHDMGVSDKLIKDAWGEKVFNINKALYKADAIDTMYAKLFKE